MKNQTIIQTSINKLRVKLSILGLLLASLFAYSPGQAQVSLSVNISSQSLWGPVGYNYVEYYYLPEYGVYYYVPTSQFIYLNGSDWIYRTYLPLSYNINLYTTYKVVINEPKPYLNHNVYVTRYAKYKSGGPKQNVIRDSQDAKYYSVKGHPHHAEGNGNNNNGNFKSNGNNNNHDNSKPAGNGNNNNNIKPTGNGNHDVKPSQNNQVQKQNQPAKSGGGGNNGSNKKH